MTLALKKYFYKGDVWMMRILKFMKAIQLSRFCCLFTLRQGTMMIAIVELTCTSFLQFLLLLCAAHAQDILALVSADLQLEERWSLINFEEFSVNFTNNERKMLSGQHLASIMMTVVYVGLIALTIHLISCFLLLYGTIRNSPYFLLPWTSTVLLVIISHCFVLFIFPFLPSEKFKIETYAADCFLLCLELYAWLVVFSYYRELKSVDKNTFGKFPEVKHSVIQVEEENLLTRDE